MPLIDEINNLQGAEKSNIYTYTKNQRKRNTESFRGITEHNKTKRNTANATPNEKHRPQCPENALQAPKASAAYIRIRRKKENATQSEKTPCKA